MRRTLFVSRLLWSLMPVGAVVVAACEDSGPIDFNPSFDLGDGGFVFDGGSPTEAGPTVNGKPLVDLAGSSVDFGAADCQSTPDPKTLTFRNTGTAALTWSATIAGAGFAITAGASGTVPPNESGSITIAAAKIPSSTKVGAVIEGSLAITTNALPAPVTVPITVTAHGGSLELTTSAIGFGQIPIGEDAPDQALTITNVGDRPIQVTLGAPAMADFAVAWDGSPGAATVAASSSLAGAKARFKPSAAGARASTSAITLSGPVCAGDDPTLGLSGEGVTVPVAITPGTAQFGATACGATANDQTITIDNQYDYPIDFTAAIVSGPYAIAAGQTTGTIPGKTQGTVTVHANAVPKLASSLDAGALAGTMTVTTTAPGSTTATIELAQTASGAVLTLTPDVGSTIAFGDVTAGTPASKSFSIKNDGNAAATVSVSATGSGFSVVAPGGGTIAPTGADVSGSIVQTPAQVGSVSGTLAVSTSSPLCQASFGGSVTLTANVLAPVASIGVVPAMSSTCGVTTPSTVDVPVKNTGTATLTISGATASGGFVVTSSLPLTIAPGATANVTVRPPAAVVGTDVGGSSKSGVLTLTTNELGAPARTASLSTAIVGANLQLVDSNGQPQPSIALSSNLSCPASAQVYIQNAGNASATVSITTENFSTFEYGGLTPSSTVAAGETIQHSLRVWSFGPCSGSKTIDYDATGTICSLPLALTASFNVTGSSYCYCS